ncbi:MAG: sodium:solute symporter family protein [Candidatus Thermoplasmatota archaeon]|nr:sodium:solute symporter family protein [Candidatus Thermoplasmatota archaeon]
MNVTILVLSIITSYLSFTVLLGIYGYKVSKKSIQDYFLANRKIGPFVLFFTLAATNFSAFTFLGFAGEAYTKGYAFYGVMGFGTSFTALSFYIIGRRVWVLGREKGYITPPELIGGETNSHTLRMLYVGVMVIFTLPYLAIQPMSAGYVLSALTNGAIPYFYGAVFLTVFIIVYVLLGGMRTIAWTDVLQGVMIIFLLLTAVIVLAYNLGGLQAAHEQAIDNDPGLFIRSGTISVKIWLSYSVLWSLCNPMFPQLFQRFFIADSEKSLQRASIIFPAVTALLFLLPIMIGVMGRGAIPGLSGQEADSILPMMLEKYAPLWLSTLIMSGGFAAFMSTADSQLLTMSSMFTRDIFHPYIPFDSEDFDYSIGHIMVIVLALIGLAIAYDPPATIFKIVTWAFTGLAILYPSTLGVLYWKAEGRACMLSILTGLSMLILYHYELVPDFGFLPAIPIVVISGLVLFVSHNLIKIYEDQ